MSIESGDSLYRGGGFTDATLSGRCGTYTTRQYDDGSWEILAPNGERVARYANARQMAFGFACLIDEDVANRKRIGELVEEMQVMQEQLDVAIDRSQSWKNLCEQYKELAEARGEKIDLDRDFERHRK